MRALAERAARAITLAISLVFAAPAAAQIVNVQPLLSKHELTPGFALALDGAVDYRGGGVDLLLTSGNVAARYRRGRHLLFLMAHGELGVKKGAQFLTADLEHLRYRLTLHGPIDLESFAQHQRDPLRRLDARALFGLGFRVRLVLSKMVDVAVATSYMLEYEHILDDDKADAGAAGLMHRMNVFFLVALRLGPRFSVQQTAYVQPRVGRPEDVRVLDETELLSTVTKHFSVKTAFTLALDTVPPVDVPPFDLGVKTSLQLAF